MRVRELAEWHRQSGNLPLDVWYFGRDPALKRMPVRDLPLHCVTLPHPSDTATFCWGRYLAVSTSLRIVLTPVVVGLASRLYGLGIREALGACTLNAAWTLDLHHDRGSIEVGKRADLVVLDGPAESVPYRFGHNPVAMVIVCGELVHVRDDAAEERITGP